MSLSRSWQRKTGSHGDDRELNRCVVSSSDGGKDVYHAGRRVSHIETVQVWIIKNVVGPGTHRKSADDCIRGGVNRHQLPFALREHVHLLAVTPGHQPDWRDPGEAS